MLQLVKRMLLILGACSACLPKSAVAQEVPSDYQGVLKNLDRKGDFKAGVLKSISRATT